MAFSVPFVCDSNLSCKNILVALNLKLSLKTIKNLKTLYNLVIQESRKYWQQEKLQEMSLYILMIYVLLSGLIDDLLN